MASAFYSAGMRTFETESTSREPITGIGFVPHETVTHKETGETFPCEWFAICEKCQIEYADDPAEALQQHTEWIGTTPDITRVI